MQALLIGLAVMALYGLFLLIKAMRYLYRNGEKKLVVFAAGFIIIAPFLIWLSGFIPEERTNLWIVLPILILFVLWLCAGYFLESYRKNKDKLRGMGLDKRPKPPPGLMRRNFWMLGAGLGVWVYGAFHGVSNRTLDMCLLCISMFLLVSSIASFWKYRKF